MEIPPNDQQPAEERGEATRTAAADAGLVKEVQGDLFDAPEGSGLIREYFTHHGNAMRSLYPNSSIA